MSDDPTTAIAVVIPVGPLPHHARWLDETIESVREQTYPASVLVVVDDMAGLPASLQQDSGIVPTILHRPPWLLGVTCAFNHGVALGLELTHLAVMLGSDDRLEPRVLERIAETYERNERRDGYYWCDTIYQNGKVQRGRCNNAAVTAGFMRFSGGLPVDASSGAMDAALISALITHAPEMLVHVNGGSDARFWARQHPEQEAIRLRAYGGASGIIRKVFTKQFKPNPNWGRFS